MSKSCRARKSGIYGSIEKERKLERSLPPMAFTEPLAMLDHEGASIFSRQQATFRSHAPDVGMLSTNEVYVSGEHCGSRVRFGRSSSRYQNMIVSGSFPNNDDRPTPLLCLLAIAL
jgi:hypothetical protein